MSTIKTCDLCGADVNELTALKDEYKTADFKEICRACERTVNDRLWAIRRMMNNMDKTLIHRFMDAILRRRKEQKESVVAQAPARSPYMGVSDYRALELAHRLATNVKQLQTPTPGGPIPMYEFEAGALLEFVRQVRELP